MTFRLRGSGISAESVLSPRSSPLSSLRDQIFLNHSYYSILYAHHMTSDHRLWVHSCKLRTLNSEIITFAAPRALSNLYIHSLKQCTGSARSATQTHETTSGRASDCRLFDEMCSSSSGSCKIEAMFCTITVCIYIAEVAPLMSPKSRQPLALARPEATSWICLVALALSVVCT